MMTNKGSFKSKRKLYVSMALLMKKYIKDSFKSNWKLYVALASLVVACGSLILSWRQGNSVKEHYRLSLRPELSIKMDQFGLYLENKGLGPAYIKKLTFFDVEGDSAVATRINDFIEQEEIQRRISAFDSIYPKYERNETMGAGYKVIPASSERSMLYSTGLPLQRGDSSLAFYSSELMLNILMGYELIVQYKSVYEEYEEDPRYDTFHIRDYEELFKGNTPVYRTY